MRTAFSAAIVSFAIVAGLAVWNSYARGRKKLLKSQNLEEETPTSVDIKVEDDEKKRRRTSVAELTRRFDKDKSQLKTDKQHHMSCGQNKPSNKGISIRTTVTDDNSSNGKVLSGEKACKVHDKKNNLNSFLIQCTANKERTSPILVDESSACPTDESANLSNQSDDSGCLSDVRIQKHTDTVSKPEIIIKESLANETRPESHCEPASGLSQTGKLQQFQRLYPSNGARCSV